jgi:hypothetical protein
MAVKNILVDDMDKASVATDTVPFAYRGKWYEIDLSPDNVARFDNDMTKWIDASRVISAGGKKPTTPAKKTTNGSANGNGSSSVDTTDKSEYYAGVRTWARANGKHVADRGRIPGEVIDAYEEAMAKK